MKAPKRMKLLGLFCLVVAVSFATNLTSIDVLNPNDDGFKGQYTNYPLSNVRNKPVNPGARVDFTTAAELSVHAVVHVKTKSPVQQQQFSMPFQNDPFFDFFFGQPNMPQRRQQQQQQQMPMREASGSGVIISTDGYIVTNNHVVEDAKEIEITLNDKRAFKAKLIGNDPNTDIALLKIDAEKLPVIQFGNSDSIRVGEWVLAVGNPFNLTSTVTAGIISAKARSIDIINAPLKIESFIQTDAAINPGNSGGALVDTQGELVGINTAIASQTGSYAGYGFAVPVSIVRKVVADLRQYGVVQRALLGIKSADINAALAKEKNLKTLEGVYIVSVDENSAADKAGMKAEDVIVRINDVEIKSLSALQEQLGRYSPGDKVTATVLRKDKELKLLVELKNSQGTTQVISVDSDSEALGATYKEVAEKVKKELGLAFGIEVKSLSKGKFADAGIKPGFIILRINNQPVKSEADIKEAYKATVNNGEAEKVFFISGVYANGKSAYYAVNLAEEK